MSATSKGSATAAFTARRKHKFRLPAQTERKLQCEVCSRKLKVVTEGQRNRIEHTTFNGGDQYVFCHGIHDSDGGSAGDSRRVLPSTGRSRCQHYRFSVEPRVARKKFGSYGD